MRQTPNRRGLLQINQTPRKMPTPYLAEVSSGGNPLWRSRAVAHDFGDFGKLFLGIDPHGFLNIEPIDGEHGFTRV